MSLKRIELSCNVGLREYTTIKVGGRAKSFFVAHNDEDLSQIIEDFGVSHYMLGKGSNLLIKDGLIQKPVIKLGKNFGYIRNNYSLIELGAAASLSSLMKYCLENDLGGVENLVGIPATIGGALSMNASSFDGGLSSSLKEADVMDNYGNIKTLKKEQIIFRYRFSSLQDYIILRARFCLSKRKNLRQRMNYFLKRRLKSQEFVLPSCGCVFKNHSEFSAGFLIESCGLKGLGKGDARVSSRHANFIVNLNSAKYADVDYLIKKIKEKVYKKYNIVLREEIKRWN